MEDLVLPQRSYAQFGGVLGQLRHGADLQRQYRSLADDDGGASQTVLIAGPRGSGKTLVARVLSTSLALDLYRIELDDLLLHWKAGDRLPLDWLYRRLGASRLAVQLRDSGGDESSRTAATALLVKTLVRHLRRRDGVLIVTRAAVPQGPAWPHFDHVMHTLSPSPEVRQTIWRVLLGPDLPLGVDVDINELAEVDLSGAEIRMSIRRAAFQALKDQRAITHADLMEAANEISRR
jgi:SpoVK/Ycf46/Vps4 family AAA+-type ATPase